MRHESMITTLMRAFLYTKNKAKELTILIHCDLSYQIKLLLFKNTDIGQLNIWIAVINMISFKNKHCFPFLLDLKNVEIYCYLF